MLGALDVHRELLARDVPHEIVRLRRIALHADELPDALALPAAQCAAVRMYVADGVLVAIAVPAGKVPDPAALIATLGCRVLRPASPAEVNARTDYAAGLVCPLLLPEDLTVVVDAELGGFDVLYTATGDTGTALGIRTGDLLVHSGAKVAELTQAPLPETLFDLR